MAAAKYKGVDPQTHPQRRISAVLFEPHRPGRKRRSSSKQAFHSKKDLAELAAINNNVSEIRKFFQYNQRIKLQKLQHIDYSGLFYALDQARLFQSSGDKTVKQWMRFKWARFQFWMELYANEPRMIRPLDDFWKQAVW